MKEYTVIWHTGPIDAKNHKEAAERALKMMRDPQSSINDMFTVIEHNGSTKHIDLTQSRTGPKTKEQFMKKPDKCDFCNTVINDEFVDGKSAGGPWACMCINCHSLFGIGLGTGKGQRYYKQDDIFIKVEG